MGRQDGRSWRLTDEDLPDLFEMVDRGDRSDPAQNDLVDGGSDGSSFATDLASDIANTLSGEFSTIERPPAPAAPQKPSPAPTPRPVRPRRRPPPLPAGPPPVPVRPAPAEDPDPLNVLDDGAPTQAFRIDQGEDDLFELEQTVMINTSAFEDDGE
jgi:hypothetical protein